MHVVTVHDPFHPLRGREVRHLRNRRRICKLTPKTNKPFVVFVDGQPVLRQDWERSVGGDQIVVIYMLPQGGGGGSNPLRIVGMLAIIAAAFYFGGAIGALMGPGMFGGGVLGLSTAAWTAIGTSAIMFGGSMLLNAVVPPPSLSNNSLSSSAGNTPAPSPTYNLQAQGNVARLGQPIPVQYGRLRVYPDFAAQPYVEYASNEQYLYQLMCVGQGEFDVEQIQIADSPISSFANVEYELVPPGAKPTLFPANVTQSSEVSGQELVTQSGSYSRTGTTITVTSTAHGLSVGNTVYLDFTSGGAVDGSFTVVSAPTADTFTVTSGTSGSTSGSVLVCKTIGPFTANGAGTVCREIGIDVVCPRGLYYANDSGGLDSRSVTFRVEARLVDQSGAPLGSWTTLTSDSAYSDWSGWEFYAWAYGPQPGDSATEQYMVAYDYENGSAYYLRRTRTLLATNVLTITGATTTAIRNSYKFAVSQLAGGQTYPRFQVRLTRTNAKDTSSRAGNEIAWAGMRAYLPDATSYGNVTLLAVRAQATNNLSSMSSRQVNVIATRKIKTVTATGLSATTSATRSVAAALADIATNTTYGGGIAAANIDWAALYALDQTLTARGDFLDVRFDSATTLWDAMTQAGVVARTKPFMQGGVMHFCRDQAATVPVALFSMRNIVQNSMSINYLTPTAETADAVQVTYFDSNTWQQTTVNCALPGSASENQAKISLLGVTSRDQAFREGLYQAAANKYRRKVIKFSTEAEGFIPAFGDLIAIQHDIPAWGQVGEVTAWDAATKTLTVNEALTWTAGQTHYVGLRKRDGSIAGPYVATQGAASNILVLAVAPSFTPYVGADEERTQIAFGPGDTWRQPARVVSVQPRGPYQVEITAINEDPSVHTAENGRTAPALNYSQLPTTAALPAVTGLTLVIDVSGATPQYVASWNASPGADHYVAEISFDGGSTWAPLATEFGTSHRWAANLNATATVRVAAVNIGRGAWATAAVSYASAPSAPAGFTQSLNGTQLKLSWAPNPELDVVGYEVRHSDSGWGSAGAVFSGFATSTPAAAPLAGEPQTFYLRAFDFLGNYSATSATLTFVGPPVPNITGFTASFFDTSATSATVTLTWANVAPDFGLTGYQISYGSTVLTTGSNTITLPADWLGDRAFTVRTIDQLGNLSSGYTQTVTKQAPNSPTGFRAQVIDNTVMLYWQQPSVTTLPVSHYTLRRGATWGGADVDYGRKDGLFTTVNETSGGTYTYWVATVDTDGNESTPVSITAVVAQPPDFVLYGEFASTFTGTKSSAILEAGAVVLPVNTTETWASHFTSRSWSTPQDQIDAGFPVFIQPSNSPGYYEETFDFGTLLASSRVSAAYATTTVAGSPVIVPTVSTSPDGTTWSDFEGQNQIFATNFRYVKVRVTVTDSAGTGIATLNSLNVTLDAKLKTDAGSVACVSTDASGTVANFTAAFVDVASITVTASGTTPITAVYDFLDSVIGGTYSVTSNVATINATGHNLVAGQKVRLAFTTGTAPTGVYTVASVINANSYTVALTTPNTTGNVSTYPQGMRVYLFNSSGARVSGTASWSIRGT